MLTYSKLLFQKPSEWKKSALSHRWVTYGLMISMTILSMNVSASTTNPTVTGPITCSSPGIICKTSLSNVIGQPLPTGLPHNSQVINPDWASTGFHEKEYFIEGHAIKYQNSLKDANGNPLPLRSDGLWQLTPQVDTNGNVIQAPYKTRILVRAPADPKKFNGTVLVEWANVSGGYDLDIEYAFITNKKMNRYGNAYVLVSAQKFGIDGIKNFDTRYSSLVHPGDDYSLDIFSQVAKVILNPTGINPLTGLKVKKLIAIGQSQSGQALVSYLNGVQPLKNLYDGFLIDSHFSVALNLPSLPTPFPAFIRTDLKTPILNFEEESAVAGNFSFILLFPVDYYFARQPDTKMLRTWEVAGASHLTAHEWANLGLRRVTQLPLASICPSKPVNDGLIAHYVHNAALRALNIWVNTGIMIAQQSPELSVNPPSPNNPILPILNVNQFDNMIGPDGLPYGIAIGGIRTPFVDVPLGVNSGKGNDLNFPCSLAGTTIPYDENTIKALYPTHPHYVGKVAKSTLDAVKKGFITPVDGLEILETAIQSNVGK